MDQSRERLGIKINVKLFLNVLKVDESQKQFFGLLILPKIRKCRFLEEFN